jgi:transcriptional regulator with XRE-family HTH domain
MIERLTTGERVMILRRRRGMTQQQLARVVPCLRTTINRIECGRSRAMPGMLARLAFLLGVDRDWLAGGPEASV